MKKKCNKEQNPNSVGKNKNILLKMSTFEKSNELKFTYTISYEL